MGLPCLYTPPSPGSLCQEGQVIPWLCTAGHDSAIKTMAANVAAGLARVQYSQGRVKSSDCGSAALTAITAWLPRGMRKEANLPRGKLHCREKVTTVSVIHLF